MATGRGVGCLRAQHQALQFEEPRRLLVPLRIEAAILYEVGCDERFDRRVERHVAVGGAALFS